MLNVEWRTGIGYGDFITGLGYAHTSALKYNTPVTINFHWDHSENHYFTPIDVETNVQRCKYIESILKPVPGVHVKHTFNSKLNYRFINHLDEFNPLHGLWYTTLEPEVTKKVVIWTTRFNVKFPGLKKDPARDYWEIIIEKLESLGYNVVEVTYRTPVKEIISHINTCAFGVGYDGLAHQLFKIIWKPLVVLCERHVLNSLLVPQAFLESDPIRLINTNIEYYIDRSRKNIDRLLIEHKNYIDEKLDPTKHRLYNTPIY